MSDSFSGRSGATVMRLAWLLVLGLPLAGLAQSAARVPRIGWVSTTADEASTRQFPTVTALVDSLRELGFTEGRDFAFEWRFIANRPQRFGEASAELARLPVDLLIAGVCGAPLDGAREATKTIPIVVPTCNDDLVELGIVKSLAHPGGNITGMSKLTPELAPKRLDMLLQALPRAQRLAVLWNPAYSSFKADWRELRAAAGQRGVALQGYEFRQADELEPVIDSIALAKPDAVIMFSDLITWRFAPRVAARLAQHRLPAIAPYREFADGGGLMSYGPNIVGMWRQSARLVARILKGEKAGDLPIEQPTRFEFVVNQKAARQLGIVLPRTLQVQADEVID